MSHALVENIHSVGTPNNLHVYVYSIQVKVVVVVNMSLAKIKNPVVADLITEVCELKGCRVESAMY